MGYVKRNCDNCGKKYQADTRNLKRGWGLCCSKGCAASKREKGKPTYNPERVEANNIRREAWNDSRHEDAFEDPFMEMEITGRGVFDCDGNINE